MLQLSGSRVARDSGGEESAVVGSAGRNQAGIAKVRDGRCKMMMMTMTMTTDDNDMGLAKGMKFVKNVSLGP